MAKDNKTETKIEKVGTPVDLVIEKLANGDLTKDQATAELLGMLATKQIDVATCMPGIDRINAIANQRPLSITIGKKGTVSVMGIHGHAVALYPPQWERLIAYVPTVAQFLVDKKDAIEAKRKEYEASDEYKAEQAGGKK